MAEGRKRDAAATRSDLLLAARARFAAEGYERTTMRAVAADVGVDPALIVRYFGTKQDLFAQAADFELQFPDLRQVPPDRLADTLLPYFFTVWEEDGTFLALLRAAMTSDTAAATMRQVFAQQVAPALGAVAPDHHPQRAALLGAFLMGLACSRYLLKVPPAAGMTREELVAVLRPVFAHLLTGPYS